MNERILPQAIEAEQNVLGACLKDSKACEKALNLLTSEHFYVPKHQKIFRAIRQRFDAGDAIDVVTVGSQLETMGQLAEIGARPYLWNLVDSVVVLDNVEYYCAIVSEAASKNAIINYSAKLINQCYEPETVSRLLLDDMESAVKDIRALKLDKIPIRTGRDMALSLMDSVENAKQTHITGYRTGYEQLDNLILGLQQGYFIILGARPSMGKTAMALNITRHLAFSEKIPTLFISLETSEVAIGRRFAVIMERISSYRMRRGNLTNPEWTNLSRAVGTMAESPFYLAERNVADLNQITRLIEQAIELYGVKVVFIDYLQIIQHKSRSRNEEVMEISGRLQNLAHTKNIPIIALSQLSREADGEVPQLRHLRDSGAVEQDASQVLFLYRKRNGDGELSKDGILIVAKAKDEKTGAINFEFDGENMRFIMQDTIHKERKDAKAARSIIGEPEEARADYDLPF